MENKIFGYDWEDIQRAQQGGQLHLEVVNADVDPLTDVKKHKESDMALFVKHGAAELEVMGFHGVLDRLKRGGVIFVAERSLQVQS